MKVSFEGVGEQVLSFEKASGTEKGVFVKVSANNTVAACAAADNFAGYCIDTADGFAVVKTHGYIEVGRRKGYYSLPKEDAVLMTCFLSEEEK